MDINSNSLSSKQILNFARKELHHVIGTDYPGRIFLAGGVFKSLLHGRRPRDFDIWAPSPTDRELLIHRLQSRCSQRARHTYADSFMVDGREVEVPDKTEPPTLEEHLGHFDLALSAIGVELAAGNWHVVVHPLAETSVKRKEVLLLKPLVNWRHCLSTLARARRYADELGYTVPAEEEAAIWAVFDAQDITMKQGMLKRYRLAAMQGWGVIEEAERRI